MASRKREPHRKAGEGFQPVVRPPSSFDPLKAASEELIKYSYPRKPPKANKSAYKIWRAIVSGPLPTGAPPMRFLSASLPEYETSFAVPTSMGREETSRNWSGVVTHSSNGGRFISVFGMWQVPAVSAPTGASNGVFRCSTWIGLDGTRQTLPSLPQIGTTQSVRVKTSGTTVELEAWTQWWSRGHITHSDQFKGFPISVGDVIACGIDVVSGLTVNTSITNVTKGTPPVLRTMYPIAFSPGGGLPPVLINTPVTGTTAEWIAERPRRYKPPQDLFPLPVFDRVTFLMGTVTEAGGTKRGLGPVKVIRMVEPVAGAPATLQVLSRAKKDYLAGTSGIGSEIAVAGPGLEHAIGG